MMGLLSAMTISDEEIGLAQAGICQPPLASMI